MNQHQYYAPSSAQKPANPGMPAIILAVMALLFAVIGNLQRFVHYTSDRWGDVDARFHFPNFWNLLFFLLSLAPLVLLLIYLLNLYKEKKPTAALPIIFGLVAAASFFSITEIFFQFLDAELDDTIEIFFEIVFDSFENFLFYLFFDLAILVTFILGAIGAAKGFCKKVLLFLPAITKITVSVIYLINFLANSFEFYMDNDWFLIAIGPIALNLSSILLCVALLVHCLKNPIPAMTKSAPKAYYPPRPYGYNAPVQNHPDGYNPPAQNQPYGYNAPAQNQPYGYNPPAQNQPYGYNAPAQNQPYGYNAPAQNEAPTFPVQNPKE